MASGVVLTWHRFAVINILLTIFAGESGVVTFTDVIINKIDTGRVVLARISCAIIDIDLTMLARPAGLANTSVIGAVVDTSSAILTRRIGAHVGDVLAPVALKTRLAITPVTCR